MNSCLFSRVRLRRTERTSSSVSVLSLFSFAVVCWDEQKDKTNKYISHEYAVRWWAAVNAADNIMQSVIAALVMSSESDSRRII